MISGDAAQLIKLFKAPAYISYISAGYSGALRYLNDYSVPRRIAMTLGGMVCPAKSPKVTVAFEAVASSESAHAYRSKMHLVSFLSSETVDWSGFILCDAEIQL